MFKIGVQTGGVEQALGSMEKPDIDAGYRAIAEAGFDAADANVDTLFPGKEIKAGHRSPVFDLTEKEVCAVFAPRAEAAKKYGIENYQAHAPFPSYVNCPGDPQYNDYLLEMLRRTVIGCASMDCHRLIIHPFFLPYSEHMTPEDEWELNIERYGKLIPAAKEYGVTICLENMFSGFRGKLYKACCSDIDTAVKYVDTLNGIAGAKVFGFCLDTGHLLLTGQDFRDTMVKLGSRIEAFHVHDNNGMNDQHMMPFTGVGDWSRFIRGLKEIGYNKTLCFETYHMWELYPVPLALNMFKLIADTGRYFDSMASK